MGGQQNAADVYSLLNSGPSAWGHLTGLRGDDPVGSALGFGADVLGWGQAFGQDAATALGATKFAAAAATPVINAGLWVLMGMSNMSGLGTPDQGQDFGSGADAFAAVGDDLGSTGAPGSWAGDGADTYTGQNELQRGRATSMALLDSTVNDVLKREAQQVTDTRRMIDRCATGLTLAIPAALAAKAVPGYGEALSLSIQAAAVALALPPAEARLAMMAEQSSRNATLIRRTGAGYDRIGTEARPAAASGGNEVSVTPADLQRVSTQQEQVVANIGSANQTTDGTSWNVAFSHGLMCAPTNVAVVGAVASRSAAARTMAAKSTELAQKLDTVAAIYVITDQHQQGRVDGQMHPR